MDKKIKTGLVGFGLSGKYFHAPFLATNSAYEIAAVLERTKSESKEIYPYSETIRSMEELANREDIDLVVITTPNETHVPYAKMALQNGKHVVLEKPIAATASEADDLIRIAEENEKILTVYQNRRFDGDFMTVQKILSQNHLGRIVEFQSAIERYRKESPFRGWKAEDKPGAGILFDLGPHLIDQAFVLFGHPESIWANLNYDHLDSKIDDGFTVFMQYRDLRVILKAGTLVRNAGPRFIIHGENGSFVKYGFDVQEELLRKGVMPESQDWAAESESLWGKLYIDCNGCEEQSVIETIPGNYHLFYNNLADAINKKSDLSVKASEAGNVIRAIELAHKSFIDKKVISFN
jgi:scyllo-inositol 2-dehydrogenase (NADP+)